MRPKVVIVGGGFAGLNAAKQLKDANVDLLLIDRTNYHLFQPLLYQVATAALSPGNIAAPLRAVLRDQQNATVIMATVNRIDLAKQLVITAEGAEHPFDYLILAPGAKHAYFGHPEWETHAPGLKTIGDAITIREKVLSAFELAERSDDPEAVKKLLRFIIIGGGPTGVEMAGAIAEIAFKTMFNNFRKIKPENSEILLIEGAPQILPAYPVRLGNIAKRALEKLGVHVMTNSKVTNVTSEGVYVNDQLIEASTIIWAAGNEASHILPSLNVPLDQQGRVLVNADLTIPRHANVFVIGDAAHAKDKKGNTLPGIAPVAIQEGRYVGNLIKNQTPATDRKPFKYFDKGSLATIGKTKAVGMIRRLQISGFFAWLTWSLVHIFYLVTFRNRIIVMIQWFFLYLTGGRNVRLITRPQDEEY